MRRVRVEYRSDAPETTGAIAAALGRRLRGGDFVALRGDLGAGKTQFVRGLAVGLGVDARHVASPTFVLATEHAGTRVGLAHLDAWRLGGPEDLESIGYEELRARGDLVMAVEWPERLGVPLPREAILVDLVHEGQRERRIVIDGPREVVEGLVDAAPAG